MLVYNLGRCLILTFSAYALGCGSQGTKGHICCNGQSFGCYSFSRCWCNRFGPIWSEGKLLQETGLRFFHINWNSVWPLWIKFRMSCALLSELRPRGIRHRLNRLKDGPHNTIYPQAKGSLIQTPIWWNLFNGYERTFRQRTGILAQELELCMETSDLTISYSIQLR